MNKNGIGKWMDGRMDGQMDRWMDRRKEYQWTRKEVTDKMPQFTFNQDNTLVEYQKEIYMQIKLIMRYHLISIRTATLTSPQITNAGEGVEKRELTCTVGGNVSWYNHYREQNGGISEN